MDIKEFFNSYKSDFDVINTYDESFLNRSDVSIDTLKNIFSCIDLTTLNSDDNTTNVSEFCDKVISFNKENSNLPNVAAVCVYPVFASILKSKLEPINVNRAVVSAGFPSSQTFLETKLDECKRAIYLGANEVDIVISVGEMIDGNYEFVMEEIAAIKHSLGDVHLKVILETGLLVNPELIWKASLLAMVAGADFIKTSTGKVEVSATLEAAWIMTHAIKAYHTKTKKMVGFKPAGGISTVDDALLYWNIQRTVLGDKWLTPQYFRIGASRLANNILNEMNKFDNTIPKEWF